MSSIFRPVYRELTAEEKLHVNAIKTAAEQLLVYIERVDPGRERSLAITKLEESVMWAVKGVTG